MERRENKLLVRAKQSCVDGSRNRVHLQNFIFVVNQYGYFDSFAPSWNVGRRKIVTYRVKRWLGE